jgi:ribosomal protein S18 acetylase RimI-like enzyme
MAEPDIRAVAEIRVRTWQASYAGLVPAEYLGRMSVDFDYERRRRDFHDPDRTARTLVGKLGGRVAGFAVAGPSRDADAAGAGEVHALYVLPELQHAGVGRALLGAAVESLAADGYRRCTLWVLDANASARRFYERAGWRPDGARHVYTKTGADLPELRYARPTA